MQPKLSFILAISLFLVVIVVKNPIRVVNTKTARNVPHLFIGSNEIVMVQDTAYYENQKFSGIEVLRYINGDIALLKPYYEGLEEGWIKKWYPNHVLAEKRFYIAGRKEGLHEAWWPNGKRKFIYHFDNDEFNGIIKEWYEQGGVFKEFHYNNGHEEGSQKMYWENGKARANYFIQNGRRYGLLGTKNCINVADSIPFKR